MRKRSRNPLTETTSHTLHAARINKPGALSSPVNHVTTTHYFAKHILFLCHSDTPQNYTYHIPWLKTAECSSWWCDKVSYKNVSKPECPARLPNRLKLSTTAV